MTITYKTILSGLALSMLATGCSDDKWQPGPEPEAGSETVFFAPRTSYEVVIQADDSRIVPITLKRATDLDKAVTVPLQATVEGVGISCPSEASFAAGEAETTFDIDCSAMANKTTGNVDIKLPENFTSPYGAGSTSLLLTINVTGGWVLLADDVTTLWGSTNADFDMKLYKLEGSDIFRFSNFFGTGLNFNFKVGDQNESYPLIFPQTNYITYEEINGEDDGYQSWYIYDRETAEYPMIYPYGNVEVTDCTFSGDDYTYARIMSGLCWFNCAVTYGDGTDGWVDIQVKFTPKFNPFTSDGPGE